MSRKNKLFLFTIIFFASILRLYQLGTIPVGITNDEAGFGITALSLWQTGRSVDGKFLPLSINLDNSFAPIGEYIVAPFVGILGLSPFSMRLPFALLSIVSVYLIYRISLFLFDRNDLALISALVLAISPWAIQMNRVCYDGPISFFFILGTFMFLKLVKKGSILWTLPVWALAFYSYHATKFFFIAYMGIIIWIFRADLLKRRREFIFYILGLSVIIASFFVVVKSQGVTRQQILIGSDRSKIDQYIGWERRINIGPQVLKPIFNNKYLYFFQQFRENYLEAFSPQFLFLYGETGGLTNLYGTGFRGVLYIIELPLLLLGIGKLVSEKKYISAKNIILASLIFAPLGSGMANDRSYTLRSIMMLPFLVLIIALGIIKVISLIKRLPKTVSLFCFVIGVGWYLSLVISYLYQYYYRYPVYAAESYFQSSKDISLYIAKRQNEFREIVIADSGPMFLFQYGIWNHVPLIEIKKAWNANWPKKVGALSLVKSCTDVSDMSLIKSQKTQNQTLYILRDSCQKSATPSAVINNLADPGQTIWKIYE